MLPFPAPRPTGHPPQPVQPSTRPILPLHATDKPLPPHPSSPRARTTSSESESDTQRGIRRWWKRNRQRTGGASPGQAELGVSTQRKEGRRDGVEALMQGLSRVTFGGGGPTTDHVPAQDAYSHKDLPSPSRALAVHSLPSTNSQRSIPDSQRLLRPPVFAPHVASERMHHSASAPQFEVSSRTHGQHQENDLFPYDSRFSASHRRTTFEPDPRTLERLPDRPATYVTPSKHTAPRSASQPAWIIPSLTSTPRSHQAHPLTPSRKPNSPLATPRTPAVARPSPHVQTPSSRSGIIASPASHFSNTTPPPLKSVPAGGTTVQCSGFTQRGQRCKKRVKAVAPYYAVQRRDGNGSVLGDGACEADVLGGEEEKRFCKVHVGQICSPEGFYAKSSAGRERSAERERWIQFSEYIPHDLEEQTKALLRLTMESPLSANESAGYIYAYELRDISTNHVGYYKVGRTDNVPRRLNEWTKQCASHRPTLRDIFPQRDPAADATQTLSGPRSSVLPGAMANQGAQCHAVKRLEKLIHMELSARQVTAIDKPTCYVALMGPHSLHTGRPCPDCSTTHREIFAIPRRGAGAGEGNEYETIVRPVILRWQRFIQDITL